MRVRTRMRVQPAFLVLLLLAIVAVRAVEAFPQETLSSLHRMVTHPGKYLEGATYTMDDIATKQVLKGKRWWKQSGPPNNLESQFLSPGTADLPSRFSDSGGFLQLCLLLIFCLAVMCCASMSINPWYKLDSTFFKRCLAAIWVGCALVLDMALARLVQSTACKTEQLFGYEARQAKSENGRSAAQAPQKSSKKAAKAKKRRSSFGGGSQHSELSSSSQQSRSTEESGPMASVESKLVAEGDSSQKTASHNGTEQPNPVVYLTPADAQIARLEAEAAEKQMQRLVKQKKLAAAQSQSVAKEEEKTQQIPQPEPEPEPVAVSQKVGKPARQSVKHESVQVDRKEIAKVQPERKPVINVHVKTYPRRAKEFSGRSQELLRVSEGEQKEKGPRRAYNERSGNVAQVLLVPRRALYSKNKPVEAQPQANSEEPGDRQMAPHTPDRMAVQAARSPLNSPQSLASPSRPYAEVAKENLPRSEWTPLPIVPPPPPPPPRRLSALPKSAVYAQEFTPAAHRLSVVAPPEPRPSGSVLLPLNLDEIPALARLSAPPSLDIAALPDYCDSSVATSPFPGMSLHRKRNGLPVTGMYSNVLPNHLPAEFGGPYSGLTSRATSSTESDPSPAFLARPASPWPIEPGFPGILDTIWGNGAQRGSEMTSSRWLGNHELVSDVSLASSSDLGSTMFGRLDPPLLSLGL